jgi:7,8-dihydro-6-hydroxymethylpterin dimethyltransferase
VVMYEKVISGLRGRWTASANLPFHGPWHHGLVAGILICALRNNGYEFDDEDIKEALKRGLMMPAGSCGFLGLCGAGAGLGIALSIIQESTPFHDEERTRAMKASEEVLKRIARLGGPRCCTLSTYTTLHLAGRVLKDFGYEIPVSSVGGRCADHELNPECHGERCPYFPR